MRLSRSQHGAFTTIDSNALQTDVVGRAVRLVAGASSSSVSCQLDGSSFSRTDTSFVNGGVVVYALGGPFL